MSREHRAHIRRRRPALETLESRKLLTIAYDPVTDVLTLGGSAGNDIFSVARVMLPGGEAIRVQEFGNPPVRWFPTATQPIVSVVSDLRAGNDTLTLGSDVDIPLVANGGPGNDSITGGSAKDTIQGGEDGDTIVGNAGDDALDGDDPALPNSGPDTIHGGEGKDIIHGYLGNDFLYGDGEDDWIYGGQDSDDHIEGADGVDHLFGEGGNDTILGDEGTDVISGGEDQDTIHGGPEADFIAGDDGRDTILGDEGDDVLDGGDDPDFLGGGDGNDTLRGGLGNDTLVGDDLNPLLVIEPGNDTLYGEADDDTLHGGELDDTLDGGHGVDELHGDDGDDTLRGGTENDAVGGGEGNDRLYGDDGDDVIEGEGGDDHLFSGSGLDFLDGGANDDTLISIDDDALDVLWGMGGLDSFWIDKYGGLGGSDFVFDADPDEADHSVHEVLGFENGADRSLDGDDIAEPTGGAAWRDYTGDPLFASSGPTYSDVRQSESLADCWLMSSLAAAAHASPNAIRQLVVDLGDGTFAVQLNDKHFRVDSEFAVYEDTPDVRKYAKGGAEGSLWVAAVEEAFAMLRGDDYDSLNNDTTYFALGKIGGEGRHWPIEPDLEDRIADVDVPGIAGTYVTDRDEDDVTVLTDSHWYAVIDIDVDLAGEVTHVTLYNPYGEDDENYYGDGDPEDGLVTITIGELEHDAQSPVPLVWADFSQFNW